MERRLLEYLRQMKLGSQDAIDFASGMSYAVFEADVKTQRAVAMSLVIVGEAAKKLEEHFPEFTAAHPEIPWVNIRGMRNRIAHDYFVLNFKVIWKTVESELPLLWERVSAIHESGA